MPNCDVQAVLRLQEKLQGLYRLRLSATNAHAATNDANADSLHICDLLASVHIQGGLKRLCHMRLSTVDDANATIVCTVPRGV